MMAQKHSLLPDTLDYCFGDSAHVIVKAQLENTASIRWDTPQGIITNTKKVSAIRPGKYYVRVVSTLFSGPVVDSAYVRVFYKVKPLLRDTQICRGKTLVLDARYPSLRFVWNTGETNQKISIESPGRYWVKLVNGSCTTVDTVLVKLVPGAGVVLDAEHTFCMSDNNKVIFAKVNPGTRMLWNTGATTSSMQVSQAGTYWLRTESNNCGEQVDSVKIKLKVCECEMIIPNSFTPNEDNRNDYFFPVLQCEYTYFNMSISDRWGNSVFTTNSANGKWDGRFKGNLCPEDIYVYRIESTEKAGE